MKILTNYSFLPPFSRIILTLSVLQLSCFLFHFSDAIDGSTHSPFFHTSTPSVSGTESRERNSNVGGLVTIIRRSVAEGPAGSVNSSTTLILAPKRTHRRDPLDGFNLYTGGWNISNLHYWALTLRFSEIGARLLRLLSTNFLLVYFRATRKMMSRKKVGKWRIVMALWGCFITGVAVAVINLGVNLSSSPGATHFIRPHMIEALLESVGFTAVPLFIIAGIWFLVFGFCLFIISIRHCCCKREPFGYSRVCYALSLMLLIFFTIAAIIGCFVLYIGQGRFHSSTTSTLEYVLDQAETTVQKLRNVTDYLSAAKQIGVNGVGLPSSVQSDVDQIVTKTNSSANLLEDKTTNNSDDIQNVLDSVRLALIIIAAVMLFLTFLGFLLSLFGLQSLVYVLVVFGWIFVAGTFILCGVFLLLHNVTEDTCVSMNQWVQHPTEHTALDDILPCVDNTTSQETLKRSKEVTSQLVDVINQVITNVSNINFSPNFPPMYYNQSGPLLPLLCNPFYKDLSDRPCSSGEVDLDNATQVWKNYVCEVSSSGICETPGRLTPTYYNQMAAAVNVSYGLYNYGPFLVELQDCTFVRQTFTDITRDYCPGLQQYSKWVYIGLAMVSAAVMLSLTFWVIYGRERKHRVYTKHAMDGAAVKT